MIFATRDALRMAATVATHGWITMSDGEDQPPTSVTYYLEQALELLAALEEARDTLRDTEHLAGVLTLEAQIQLLSRRLGVDDGGTDAT